MLQSTLCRDASCGVELEERSDQILGGVRDFVPVGRGELNSTSFDLVKDIIVGLAVEGGKADQAFGWYLAGSDDDLVDDLMDG